MLPRPLHVAAAAAVVAALAAAAIGWTAGCSSTGNKAAGGGGSGTGATCSQCGTTGDCAAGEICAKFPGENYCIPSCDDGQACSSDSQCLAGGDYTGAAVHGCVPMALCAAPGTGDDGGGGGTDSGVPYDGGGPPPSGSVGPSGGTLSRLLFAVVGDTRPANYDDVAGYPTAIITQIFKDIEAQSPRPPFVVSTGDYQFASSGSSSTAGQQIDIYEQALSNYSGIQFPAMGNHECTGATASNCGPNGQNGMTANYQAFMQKMLGPIQKTLPYYSVNVNASDGSWTSKFVLIAANAWDDTQASWLQQTMAQKTTYTFVVRHEPSNDNTAPGVTPSDGIISQYPYTLFLNGHSHTYSHYSGNQTVIGNGGAPLSGSGKNYGYGLFSQRADGAIVCDMIDYQSGQADSRYHFVVKADGTLTQ